MKLFHPWSLVAQACTGSIEQPMCQFRTTAEVSFPQSSAATVDQSCNNQPDQRILSRRRLLDLNVGMSTFFYT